MKVGDIILKVNDIDTETVEHIIAVEALKSAGEEVILVSLQHSFPQSFKMQWHGNATFKYCMEILYWNFSITSFVIQHFFILSISVSVFCRTLRGLKSNHPKNK